MPITNDAGQTAIKYYQPANRILVEDTTSGKPCVFTCKASVTMAWVDEADVANLLARRKHCCGNTRRQIFFYANENDVRQWTNGGGR